MSPCHIVRLLTLESLMLLLKHIELFLKLVSLLIVDLLLLAIEVASHVTFDLHLLLDRDFVHLVGLLSGGLTLGLLPLVEPVEGLVPSDCQLFTIQASQLELWPEFSVQVFLHDEELKTIVKKLGSILGACEIDREREINDLYVFDGRYIDFETEVCDGDVDVFHEDISDGEADGE